MTEIEFEQALVELAPCYEWTGQRRQGTYGVMRKMTNGVQRRWYMHRVIWAMAHGDIPEGMVIRHRCDNPPCIRIDHLELGTHADNVQDCLVRGRWSHSPRGVGSEKRSAKITEADVLEIRARYAEGESQGSIAKDFPIGRTMVGEIVRRTYWTHV